MTESTVYLQRTETGELEAASLFDEIRDEDLDLWEKAWQPWMTAHHRSTTVATRSEDSHWDWRRKADEIRGLLGYRSFSLCCGEELQGLMFLNDMYSSRIGEQSGKPLIYIEYVATAPWNRPSMQQRPPKYRGVGRIFVLAAIETSFEAGFNGRVGLHSLPQAEAFYEGKCGMTRLGADLGYENLTYFEMTKEQADNFRSNRTTR